jgi:hypothetical protein
MVTYRAFDEIIDFITSIPKPEQVLAYKPSNMAQLRLSELLDKKRNAELNESELQEIEQFLMIEHIMRIAKIKAHKQVIS